MVGTKFYKPVEDWREYTQAAAWCNENHGYHIEDRGEYYEVIADSKPSFSEMKTAKLSELASSFNEQVSGSFICSQGWSMQFNRSDTLAVEGAIQLLKATNQAYGYLTDANDETHYGLSLETIEAVKLEMLKVYADCHAHKQELRKIINSAKSKEELDEITISWPV